MTPEFQRILEKKVNAIETMPLSTLYKQESVKNNNYQLYKEAIGVPQTRQKSPKSYVQQQYEPVTHPKMVEAVTDNVFDEVVSRVAPESSERFYEGQSMTFSKFNTPHRAVSSNSLVPPPNEMPVYQQPARKGNGRFNAVVEQSPQNNTSFEYSTVKFSVNYETQFGQELWFVGSTPFCGNWDPNANHGKGGLKMTWSAGHVWYVDVPMEKIKRESSNEKFEFKFVVKQSDGGHQFVSKWEGCQINHTFDGKQIQTNISKKHMNYYDSCK